MDVRKFFVKRVSAALEDDLLSFGQSIFMKLEWDSGRSFMSWMLIIWSDTNEKTDDSQKVRFAVNSALFFFNEAITQE